MSLTIKNYKILMSTKWIKRATEEDEEVEETNVQQQKWIIA